MTARVFVAVALAVTMSVAACSIAQPGSVTPSIAPSASATLNPNQQALASRSPRPTAGASLVPTAAATSSAPRRPTPTPYAADLEALLPESLRGIPLQRVSMPASTFENGGDACSILCSGEPRRLATAAGVEVEDMTVAVAIPDQRSGLDTAIIAIRFPGVETSRLVGIRTSSGGHSSDVAAPAETKDLHVGPRTIVWAAFPPFYQPASGEYLLADKDVLFLVYGDPPAADGTIPPDVALAIAALP